MSSRPTSLRSGLRSIEPDRARLQTMLIAALNQRRIEDLRTSARLAPARDRAAATGWIQFVTDRGPVSIAPLLVDGALARTTTAQGQPDGASAAATLARIEPLVAALEAVLGAALHPDGLVVDPGEEQVLIRLDADGPDGAMRHRLLVAVPSSLDAAPIAVPPMLTGMLAGLRLRWTARLPAPAIPAPRLARLARGDLILLGTGPHVARLALPGRNDRPAGRIDLAAGHILLTQDPHERDDIVTDPTAETTDTPTLFVEAPSGGAPDWSGVRVPATIEFDGGGFTAAELATLGKGSVLPLPAQGGTIAVRVIAGEKVVAEGELVTVGEGFGVLVTATRGQQED